MTRSRFRLLLVLSLLFASIPLTSAPAAAAPADDLLISGVVDGPLSGGIPKAVEFYVVNSIPDLSIYGFGSANNGGGSDGEEFTFPAVAATAGDYLYVASESTGFTAFFGFAPDYTSSAASINGDDAIELFTSGAVSDVFGDINVDGSGQPWEYTDGWAYRNASTGPDGSTFVLGNWTYSGPNALDGETTNATAATPFPIGTYGGSSPALPRLVINEIIQNPSAVSDTNGEWFEVHNPTAADADMDGWVISDNDFDTHTIDNGGPLVVPAGGYAVLARNANSATNGGVTAAYEYGDDIALGNSGDELVLTAGSDEIDRVEWDGGPAFPDPTGASMSLIDPALDNNIGANWCEATTPFGDGDLGTPGAANDCPPPPAPELVINEIIQNPSAVSDTNGEWFEVHNPTGAAIDIDGFTIEDNDFDSHLINNGGPLVVSPGGYVVLGRNANSATNGGVTVDYQYSNFFLSNGADEVVLLDGNLTEADRVEYDGGPNFPDPNGASMALRNPSFDNNVGANWCTASTPFGDGDLGTPGAANDCVLFIHEIQGSGPTVAISGPVVVEAIVTSLLEDDDVLDGFLLQEEDADADADPLTSEGIRVDCGSACAPGLAVGDLVTVAGDAGETFGMSEVDANSGNVTIESSGNPLPTATELQLPAPAGTDEELTFEPLEGMLVQFTDELFVSEYFELARFGQVVLTVDERPFQFTHTNDPSVTGYSAFLADLATRRIVFDDDNNNQNAATSGPTADTPYYWERPGFSTTNFFRGGDSITDLTGGLDWAFGEWRVKAALGAFDYTFTPNEARTAAPEAVGGTLEVASFNVLNYFTTIDNGNPICGPSGTLGCRGAHSTAELDRQRDKIVSALAAMDADVVGLVEIENNATAAVEDLVGGLNAAVGAGTYDYVDTGTIGTDAIKVALIYKPATVAPIGSFAILDSSVDSRFIDTKNRPVLVQTFEEIATAARVTVAVNHLKSKGSACDDVGDPGLGDGQANCNLTRTSAVDAMVDFLATDPTGSGDADFLIMGDLNAYAMEDPIATAEAAGYTNLIEAFHGDDPYSFVFDGQLGYLDHALSNEDLTPQVTGVTEWHINSDEVNVLDYNDGVQDPGEASFERKSNALPIYEANAYRSSDHDPVIIGLELDAPRTLKQQVLDGLEALLPAEDRSTGRRVGKAIDSVEESLDPDSWESDSTINSKKVFDQERQAVSQLMLVAADDVPEAGAAQAAIDVLVDADRQLAQVEIYAAIARGGSASGIASAQAAMAEATVLIAAGIYNEAINAYKAAWDAATKA